MRAHAAGYEGTWDVIELVREEFSQGDTSLHLQRKKDANRIVNDFSPILDKALFIVSVCLCLIYHDYVHIWSAHLSFKLYVNLTACLFFCLSIGQCLQLSKI